MKTKSKVLVSALLVIALCASVIAGTTFALFSSEDKVNIAVTSGKVQVKATPSLSEDSVLYEGSAKLDEKTGIYTVSNVVPKDKVVINVAVLNSSTVTVKYRTTVSLKEVVGNWNITINGVQYSGSDAVSKWETLAVGTNPEDIVVFVELDKDETNQDSTCSILCKVEAVQGNAETYDLPIGVTKQSFIDNGNAVAYADDVYYPTLKQAIESGSGNVYLAPKTKLTEEISHAHVSGDLNIYGNGSVITGGGEHDLEVDTYHGGLTKDITINIYDLDKVAVWGQRTTDVTININLYNCHDINRIYINGAKGVNNITLNGCSAITSTSGQHCKLYSNAPGTINVINCTFDNVSEPINLNNKSNGVQNIFVENCIFNDCSTEELCLVSNDSAWAAPVRVVATGEGAVSNLHLINLVFNYSEGKSAVNGNVLTEELREGIEVKGIVNIIE